MEYSLPLNPEVLEEFELLNLKLTNIKNSIEDRLDYILRRLFEQFDCKIDYWYFANDLQSNITTTEINNIIVVPVSGNPEIKLFLSNGKELYFSSYKKTDTIDEYIGFIPTRWLFEFFDDEIRDGKNYYQIKNVLIALQAELNVKNRINIGIYNLISETYKKMSSVLADDKGVKDTKNRDTILP
jgi:hypothetical protein